MKLGSFLNKFMIFIFLVMIFLILISTFVSAQKKITLLSIEKNQNEEHGGIADLYLRTVPGAGNIYTATFPLTKVDTQISARFARDIACDFIDRKCDDLDFLYSIEANSPAVGGPSGGAAFAVLTIAEIYDLDINQSTGITGTINTGGLIGPVGGLLEKVQGARNANMTKVLIPKGTKNVVNQSEIKEMVKKILEDSRNASINISEEIEINFSNQNKTVDLIEFGKSIGIEVIEVSKLSEAVYHITNRNIGRTEKEIEIDPSYTETMKQVSEELCNRSKELKSKVIAKNGSIYSEGILLYEKARNATANRDFYTAASFCFGANVNFRAMLYENLSPDDFMQEADKIIRFRLQTANFSNLQNLQTYLIVKQRLDEKDVLVHDAFKILNSTTPGKYKDARYTLAFARERLQSAVAWSRFFDINGNKEFTKEELESSCIAKLQEAQQRFDYANIYFPDILSSTEKQLKLAINDNNEGSYESCLFKASIAKAESDAVLSTIGYSMDQLKDLVRQKLGVAGQEIAVQDHFPILAYSYYEYANSLVEENPLAALSYAEYAIELSNLDIYFKEARLKTGQNPSFRSAVMNSFFALLLGILLGLVIGRIIYVKK